MEAATPRSSDEQPAAPARPDDLRAIVERCHARLFRLAARVLGSSVDAEDVVQESFIRALRSLRAGHVKPAELTDLYLVKVVTHVALNWLRSRKRAAARAEAAMPVGTDAASAADARIALRELADLLAVLSPDQRAALVLKELEGLTAREVGEVLGCSEGAVEQRVLRAREALKAKVQP